VAGTFIVIEYVADRSGVNEILSGNSVVIMSALSLLIRIVTALLARPRERSAPAGRSATPRVALAPLT
jgi:hypothetical protein